MFGELVIAYLFLAGVGAGGTTAASLADLLVVREPFGMSANPDFAEKSPASRLVALAFVLSCGATVLGAICLVADLGRVDRVLSLFFAPSVTLASVGAWAVALLGVASAALALVRVLYVPEVGRRAVVAVQVIAIVLSVVVAAYAGLLLRTLVGVRLWSSPWVPVLFVLSAASCGCALVMAASLFVSRDCDTSLLVGWAARVDAVVIALEVVAAVLFLGFALESTHPGVRASAADLMTGDAALPWWAGFVACGLAVPLAVEGVCLVRGRWGLGARSLPVAALALSGMLVLVGAAGLRAAVVEAGVQRGLELQEPQESQPSQGLPESQGSQVTQGVLMPQASQAALDREEVATWSN